MQDVLYITLYKVRPQVTDAEYEMKKIDSRFNVERTELYNS